MIKAVLKEFSYLKYSEVNSYQKRTLIKNKKKEEQVHISAKKNMKKTYILEDLDCAHCAALIEEKVGKLDGVTKSTVTLLTQKLVVEVEDDKAAGLLKEITKIVKKHEPDVEVIEK